MDAAARRVKNTVADTLIYLRDEIFDDPHRERYKLSFIARQPGLPEMDIVITEDDLESLRELIKRRIEASQRPEPVQCLECGGGECRSCMGDQGVLHANDPENDCSSCGEEMPRGECSESKRSCGHHCNHSWSHDCCCWCGTEFGEEAEADGCEAGG